MPNITGYGCKELVKKVHQRWWYNSRYLGWIVTKIDRLLEEILLKVTANFGYNPFRNKKLITISNNLFLVMGALR